MTKTNNSSIIEPTSQGIGFGTGIFMGALLGVVGYYMLGTEEGRKLKDKLIEQYQELGDLPDQPKPPVSTPIPTKAPQPLPPDITITETRSLLKSLASRLKVVSKSTPVTPEESGGFKLRKRSFTKSGRKL